MHLFVFMLFALNEVHRVQDLPLIGCNPSAREPDRRN